MKQNRITRKLSAWALALVLVGGGGALGVWLSTVFPTFDALPLFGLLMVAFILACLANRMAAKSFARTHFGISPEERRELVSRHVEECRADPATVLKKFSDMEAVPVAMLVLYFLLVLAMVATGGMCLWSGTGLTHALAAMFSMAMGWFLLYMPLTRLIEQIPHRLHKEALVPIHQLPRLEAMAQKAADMAGVKGTIRLEITTDHVCDVNRIGRTYVAFLGTRLLSVLTEEEMQQTLMLAFEEFAYPKLYRQFLRRLRLGMLGDAEIRRETFAFDLFFSYADAYLEWEYELYFCALKRYLRNRGYERIRREGNPSAALSAMTKKAFWPYYVFEFIHFVPSPFYASPTPPADYEQIICAGFRTAFERRNRAWLDMLEREMAKSGDMSLLYRDERRMLGAAKDAYGKLELVDLESAYGQEVMTAIRDIADARICRDVTDGYEQAREREYLVDLRVIEEYEASPEGYSTPELSPVINAYRDIGRFAEAEALCDAIMARETNQFALAHAIYFKGMCMLHRYETEGIDLIYRAIDLNKNYMKDGFEMVEEYCTLCGLEDEYDAFRHRAEIQISAHAFNHEGAGFLSVMDHLEQETELGDMLSDILGYMEQVADGCIQEVYLVRKVISEDFFTSAFVVNFAYGSSDEQMKKTYAAIFNYLDAYPVDWQFSLFVYNRETERAVKRVEGSLVWEKK